MPSSSAKSSESVEALGVHQGHPAGSHDLFSTPLDRVENHGLLQAFSVPCGSSTSVDISGSQPGCLQGLGMPEGEEQDKWADDRWG